MMKMMLVLFLIGHVLGDFYLQSNQLAATKNKSFYKLVEHGLIYSIAMILVVLPVYGLSLLKWILLMSIVHFLIDGIMFYLNQYQEFSLKNQLLFYVFDQLAHLVTIFLLVIFIVTQSMPVEYTDLFEWMLNQSTIDIQILLNWTLATAIVIQPVSITINKTLYKYQPTTVAEEEKGHPGAGSLIGILERLIILMMLAQNQYGAIGLVLTAKSIARYNKITENPQFSEYYLLGTLLSMLLVIVTFSFIV